MCFSCPQATALALRPPFSLKQAELLSSLNHLSHSKFPTNKWPLLSLINFVFLIVGISKPLFDWVFSMRLHSHMWVSAFIRQVNNGGASAMLTRRGEATAGAIYIKVALLAPTMWGNLFGVAGVYAIWHLYNEIYIPYRLKKEDEQ